MGCIAKYLLYVGAFWLFVTVGWMALAPGASLWLTALWVMLIVIVTDVLLVGFNLLLQVLALPLSCLTGGIVIYAVDGVFKYIGLYVAALLLHSYVLPYIFGPLWWQALVIGFVFAIISAIANALTPKSSS